MLKYTVLHCAYALKSFECPKKERKKNKRQLITDYLQFRTCITKIPLHSVAFFIDIPFVDVKVFWGVNY